MSETNPNMTIITPSQITDEPCEGQNNTVTVIEGPYEGIKFRYDVVWLDDSGKLCYHYTPLNRVPSDKEDFEHAIAHLLVDIYNNDQRSGEVVFHGGTEELHPEAERLLKELEAMDRLKERQFKEVGPLIEIPGEPTKNLAQQIMQAPGMFTAKKEENAMSFLDRLAAQGMAAMGKR